MEKEIFPSVSITSYRVTLHCKSHTVSHCAKFDHIIVLYSITLYHMSYHVTLLCIAVDTITLSHAITLSSSDCTRSYHTVTHRVVSNNKLTVSGASRQTLQEKYAVTSLRELVLAFSCVLLEALLHNHFYSRLFWQRDNEELYKTSRDLLLCLCLR